MERATQEHSKASTGRAENETLSERAAEHAHERIDQAARAASDAERRTRETVSRASKAADERTRGAMADLSENIREKPLAAAGIAFAVGFFASSILRR